METNKVILPSCLDIKYDIPPYPRQLRLDTTTACNAECLSCHRHSSQRYGKMSIKLIETILDDVSKWNEPLTEIVPVNYGEFLLYPQWQEVLSLITKRLPNTQIVLPTNGSLFSSEVVLALCSIPTLKIVNFSINAYFKETYQQFTSLPIDTINKIRLAIPQIKTKRPDISCWVSMVFDPAYQSDLEKELFIQYWKGWAIPQVLPAASAGRPGQLPAYPRIEPCRSIFSDIVVGFDSKISSCCFDAGFNLDLGYYEGMLLDNWLSPKLEQLRRIHNEHRRAEVSLCKACTFA